MLGASACWGTGVNHVMYSAGLANPMDPASSPRRYLTSREQELRDRRRQAAELLRWKQDLDAEEEKVRQLERSALEAWEGRGGRAEPALEGVPLGEAENKETQSDISDYEARIRQMSYILRRRQKEADMLKKERSKRMKDKLKAQEESLKRQLEAYEIYISQVKTEQADLEHEGTKRPTVPPKIKQPGLNAGRSPSPGPSASPVPGQSDHGQDELPSGHEGEKTLSPPASSSSSAEDTAKVSETNKDRSSQTSVREPITDRKDPGPDRSRPDTRKPRNEKSAIPRSTSRDSEKSSIPRSVSPGHPQSASLEREKPGIPKSNSGELVRSTSRDREKSSIPLPRSPEEGEKSGIPSSPSTDRDGGQLHRKSGIPRSMLWNSEKGGTARSSDSRLNSHRTHSRPSSERSTASTTFSDLHDFDEEEEEVEEDILVSEMGVKDRERQGDGEGGSSTPQEEVGEVMLMDDGERPMWRKVGGGQHSADGGRRVPVDEVDRSLSAMDDDLTPTHTPRIDSGPQMPEPMPMKEADGNSQHRQWVPQLQALSTRQLQMMVDSFSALESSVAQTADRPSSAPDSRDQLIHRCLQYAEPCRLVPVLIKLLSQLSSRQSGEPPDTSTTPLREYDPVNTFLSLALVERGADRSPGEQLPQVYTTQDHDELRGNVPEIQACQPDWNAPQNSLGVVPPLSKERITTVLNWLVNQNEDSSSTSSSTFDDKTTIYGSRGENGRDENKLTTILGGRVLLNKRFCSPLPLNVGTAVGFDSDSKTNDSRSLPDSSESSHEFNDLESLSSEEHNCTPIFPKTSQKRQQWFT